MMGLWRCHYVASEIAQLGLDSKPEHATALAVQLCKALLQVAIDGGNWTNAIWLLPFEDPLGQEEFGGEEEELAEIHAYRKATSELKTKALATSDNWKNHYTWDAKEKKWTKRPKGKGGGKDSGGGDGKES